MNADLHFDSQVMHLYVMTEKQVQYYSSLNFLDNFIFIFSVLLYCNVLSGTGFLETLRVMQCRL